MKRFVFASLAAGCAIANGIFACVGSDAPPAVAPTDEAGTPPGTPPTTPPPGPPPSDAGGDAAATITTLAQNQKYPATLAILGDTLYWVDTGGSASGCTDTPDGLIMSTKADGSTTTPKTIATGQKCPLGLAVTADKVYWAERGTPTGFGGKPYGDGSIKRANHDGSLPETIVQNVQFPFTVRVAADRLFYFTGPNGALNPNELWRAPLVPSATPIRLAVTNASGSGLAFDSDLLYWTQEDSQVFKLPFGADGGDDGGSRVAIGTNETTPTNPTPVGASVYWFNHAAGGTAVRWDLATATRTELGSGFAPSKGGRQLAVDAKYVYYTSATSPPGRIPIGGGTAESLAPASLGDTLGLAVDDAAIYVSAGAATGAIYRIAKK